MWLCVNHLTIGVCQFPLMETNTQGCCNAQMRWNVCIGMLSSLKHLISVGKIVVPICWTGDCGVWRGKTLTVTKYIYLRFRSPRSWLWEKDLSINGLFALWCQDALVEGCLNERGEGRKPTRCLMIGRLLLWAVGAQSQCVEHAPELFYPRAKQAPEARGTT